MALTREKIISFGYLDARQLPTGEWLAIGSSIYTLDLYIGIDETGWRCKWMFPIAVAQDAEQAFRTYEGTGHPVGHWVKRKNEHGDAHNPRFYNPALDVGDQYIACEDGSVMRGKP